MKATVPRLGIPLDKLAQYFPLSFRARANVRCGSGVSVRDADDRDERGDPHLRVAIQAVSAAGGFAFLVSVQMVERVVLHALFPGVRTC